VGPWSRDKCVELIKLATSESGLKMELIAQLLEKDLVETKAKWHSLQTHEATQLVIGANNELARATKALATLQKTIADKHTEGDAAIAEALTKDHLPGLEEAASLALIAWQNALSCPGFRLR